MVTTNNDKLCICIADEEPKQRKSSLIKAIAAAMRWNAYCPDKYKADGENLYVLAQLLEELAEVEKTVE